MKHTDDKERIREQLFMAEGWDGKQRIDTLFIDYLGVEDTPQTREVGRRFCIDAVAGVMDPDSKQTIVPVLYGVQGCGKTTLLRALCGDREYFSDCFLAEDKYLLFLSDRTLICETEETDADTLKDLLNKKAGGIRPCTFCAASFKPIDQTGDGTICPLQCHADPVHEHPAKKDPWKLLNDIGEVRQIWAEAYAAWKNGRK